MSRLQTSLDKFTDVAVRSSLQGDALAHVRPQLRHNRTISPYSLAQPAADALEDLGIPSDPWSVAFHPHAAAKSVENTLLDSLGHMLPNEPVTFLYMKRSKLRQLHRNARIKDIFLNCRNVPADVARYDGLNQANPFSRVPTGVAYISDTLHHYQPRDLITLFRDSPALQTLYATMVLPVEALHRHHSLHPEVYAINYHDSGFAYLPGSHGGGSYFHKYDDLNWLSVGSMTYGDLTVTAQLLDSRAANHLFIFQRGSLYTPEMRTFCPDELVQIPDVFHPAGKSSIRPIRKTLATQLLLYAKSLKVVTMRDLFAKFRQILNLKSVDNYDPDDLVHLANYLSVISQLEAGNSFPRMLGNSALDACIKPILARLQLLYETWIKASDYTKLIQALQWKTFTYSLPVTRKHLHLTDTLRMALKPALPAPILPEPDKPDDSPEEAEDSATEEPSPVPNLEDPPSIPIASVGTAEGWADVLRAHGFEPALVSDQVDADGHLISPITQVRSGLQRADVNPGPAFELAEMLRPLKRKPVEVRIDDRRAMAFASDVKNGRLGKLMGRQTIDWLSAFSGRSEFCDITLPMIVVHGAGGAGKSFAIQEWVRAQDTVNRPFVVILPTLELQNDWANKCPLFPPRAFKTWEKALLQESAQVVIFDDYGKLPAGYIEAYLAHHGAPDLCVLTGDPRQSVYHEDRPDCSSGQLEPAIDHFSRYCSYYLNCTHRSGKDVANILGVAGVRNAKTQISFSHHVMDGIPLLVPSITKKQHYLELGHRVFTYAGCQGLTCDRVQILLDSHTPHCQERVLYTALSRAREMIHFVNTGVDENAVWEKMDCTPFLKAFLGLHLDRSYEEPEPPEPEIVEDLPTTHYPTEVAGAELYEMAETLPDKPEREVWSNAHGYSNAIQTENSFVQLFQHQQAKDNTLLWHTIDKRIHISDPAINEAEYLDKQDIGDLLFASYASAMKLPKDPIPFEQELWDQCADEVQRTYLSKPIHQLITAAARQDPDFDPEYIELFLKSQWVKKIEKLGSLQVGAGQTIASFSQQTVMLYGTMARYMRRWRQKFQPKNIYIHCEVDSLTASKWLLKHWNFNVYAHENDFTAFDQSQDGAMLQFEVLKAKHHSIPGDIISGYIHLKMHARVFLGTLAIMRLTGEGPTFDANTECSIAYQHLRYYVPPQSAQMYAGDDMAVAADCQERASYAHIADRLRLKSKLIRRSQRKGDMAQFCGHLLTPRGLIRDPKKIWATFMLSRALDKEKDTLDACAHDASLAYALGDHLFDYLSEEQAKYHQALIRELHKKGRGEILRTAPNPFTAVEAWATH